MFQQPALVLGLVLSVAFPGRMAAETTGGRVVDVEVPAPALAGNLLDTPEIQEAAIYLPPGYDAGAERRYPVIYLLHGIFDSYATWVDHFGVPQMLDRMILSGAIPELIVVMPNGGNRYGGGYYRNSTVGGRWADYILDDLIGWVDAGFRTRPGSEGRAVVGHSMGGHGALHLAMSRPDIFSVVWAMSPCCLAVRDDLGFGNDAWKRAVAVTSEEDLAALLRDGDFYAVAALGVLAAFHPDPGAAPIYGDPPFEIERREVVLDGPAYDRFLDAFPVRRVRAARDNLRDLRGLAIGVGLDDQFQHIPTATLEFSQRLGAERIPHLLEIYTGDHREHVAARLEHVVLPWVAGHLAPAP